MNGLTGPLLALDSVTVRLGGQVRVREVTLEVCPGELVSRVADRVHLVSTASRSDG